MSPAEIRKTIDKNNEAIQAQLKPTQFILLKPVADLMRENQRLQNICKHEILNDDGYCIYCDKFIEDMHE